MTNKIEAISIQKANSFTSHLFQVLRYKDRDGNIVGNFTASAIHQLTSSTSSHCVDVNVQFETVTGNLEDIIVNKLLEVGDFLGKSTMATILDPSRAANRIAIESRRGVGNHIILHKDDKNRFQNLAAIEKIFSLTYVNTPELRGKFIVTYKGKLPDNDGGLMLAIHHSPIINGTTHRIAWHTGQASTFTKVMELV